MVPVTTAFLEHVSTSVMCPSMFIELTLVLSRRTKLNKGRWVSFGVLYSRAQNSVKQSGNNFFPEICMIIG